MLEMIKKREKYKKELLQLGIEIMEKRYDMEDFNGSNLNHAESQKSARPLFYPLYEQFNKVKKLRANEQLSALIHAPIVL